MMPPETAETLTDVMKSIPDDANDGEQADPLFDGLTEPQTTAVQHVDGALLVLAGPGSGKTTVVTRRVAHLVQQGIPPWQILALTFTNKAAGEMAERIRTLLDERGIGGRGLTVSTFHSFCARLLRRYAEQANLSQNYTIFDGGDQRDAVKRALEQCQMSTKNWQPASVLSHISNAKNKLLDAAAYTAEASDFYSRSIAKIFNAYENILRESDAMDFDDLLLRVASLLRHNEDVRSELQQRFQYLLIDEYQDTNHAQFIIAHTLASGHGNICVVGDPDQSIYGWRGADITNILDFEDHYPDASILSLGQNFRSTGHILAAADALIRNNRKRKLRTLHTELGDGEKPALLIARDEHHEADLITTELQKLNTNEDIAWKDMAVVYRMNALSRVLEQAFRDAAIPYVIARGTAFYDRKEIKDALGYLRLIVNPRDELSLRRVVNSPTRGIGKTSFEKLELYAINEQVSILEAMEHASDIEGLSARAANAMQRFVKMILELRGACVPNDAGMFTGNVQITLPELVGQVIRDSGLEAEFKKKKTEEDEQRVANLNELVSAATEFCERVRDDDDPRDSSADPGVSLLNELARYLETVALVSDSDAIDPEKGAVTLLTLHAAKGLEFEAVALAGLEEGLLPHMRSIGSDEELEEERRLCFVGITRAKRHLLLTRAMQRTMRGMRERQIESQFVRELPSESVNTLDLSGGHDDFGGDDWDQPWRRRGGGRSGSNSLGVAGSASTRAGHADVSGISIGAMVRHPTFGIGHVEAITRRPAGSSARVRFNSVGTKTLILEYAKLEVVE